jgi:glycerophosphoryl diester phosphodiesterase
MIYELTLSSSDRLRMCLTSLDLGEQAGYKFRSFMSRSVASQQSQLSNTSPMITRNCLVIAHRGASTYAPENTFAAFDLALQMGARDLELDVQMSCDGHLVVIHDDQLDRTTDGNGAVAAHTLAELQALDAGAWFGASCAGQRIPTLEALLARYRGRAHLHVEIKGKTAGLSERTADLIRRCGWTREVTMTSFQLDKLEALRVYAPELPAGWLLRQIDDAVIDRARALGLAQLCPKADIVTPQLVERLRTAGFGVRAWGVTNEDLMRSMVEAGVDGMTVNFPDKLLAFLREWA